MIYVTATVAVVSTAEKGREREEKEKRKTEGDIKSAKELFHVCSTFSSMILLPISSFIFLHSRLLHSLASSHGVPITALLALSFFLQRVIGRGEVGVEKRYEWGQPLQTNTLQTDFEGK